MVPVAKTFKPTDRIVTLYRHCSQWYLCTHKYIMPEQHHEITVIVL